MGKKLNSIYTRMKGGALTNRVAELDPPQGADINSFSCWRTPLAVRTQQRREVSFTLLLDQIATNVASKRDCQQNGQSHNSYS